MRGTLPTAGFVVRTAWLYGVHGPNFVKTMLALEASKPEISVVDDQRGQPTWSRDLAGQIVALVDSGAPAGIYHGTSSGETTWFGLTREIYRLIGADPRAGAPHHDRRLPAARPSPCLQRARARPLGAGRARPRSGDWREALAEALPLIRGADG